MRRILQIALPLLAIASAGCEVGPAVDPSTDRAKDSVMDFELTSLDGGTMSPGDAGGTLTLVDFWATWCGPCHLQADILAKLYPELRERGVEFLAVSLGEPEAVVREFVEKRPFDYPVLVDPGDTIASEYGLFVLPTVVLLDRDGTVLYLREGISTAKRLRSAVDEVLASRRSTENDDSAEVQRSASR